ncbi:MAG: Dyp-type peroxidase [Gluconacetobacter diazotrophicus]|nr:Dyp-type peroxidase [Gluconacetobacter diazotrophicus]
MTDHDPPAPGKRDPGPSRAAADRRAFLRGAGGLAAAGMVCPFSGAVSEGRAAGAAAPVEHAKGISPGSQGPSRSTAIAFDGPNQAGILTPLQNHSCFVAFDLVATDPAALPDLMRRWTIAARRMCRGQAVAPAHDDPEQPTADSGEAFGLGPARLTITFGFGPTLFDKDGHDRYGLARLRPAALADLPRFNGDQLVAAQCGGDLSVQACADDPQVAFHAVRNLARIADGVARLRWIQNGYSAQFAAEDTPRNLMGFKDGTQNPISVRPDQVHAISGGRRFTGGTADEYVWADPAAAPWMRGGSYMVARRIRVFLEHWDRTPLSFQEEVFGRRKVSGAPLTGHTEFDPLDLDATDKDGNPVIAENAHVRLGSAATTGGAQILRRSFSYNDGLNFVAERWPPWHQGLEYDAGLFFLCYQKDPREGFTRIFETMSRIDLLNQYATHVGSGLFAVPPGTGGEGGYVGETLFKAAGLHSA